MSWTVFGGHYVFSDIDIVGPRNTLSMSVVNSGSSYPFLYGDAWEPWMLGTHVPNETSALRCSADIKEGPGVARLPGSPSVMVSLDGVLDYRETCLGARHVHSGCVHEVVSTEG